MHVAFQKGDKSRVSWSQTVHTWQRSGRQKLWSTLYCPSALGGHHQKKTMSLLWTFLLPTVATSSPLMPAHRSPSPVSSDRWRLPFGDGWQYAVRLRARRRQGETAQGLSGISSHSQLYYCYISSLMFCHREFAGLIYFSFIENPLANLNSLDRRVRARCVRTVGE